ncbi:MAG: hypothetical protein LH702_28520 [Phormidesmis sp. CAN_BIN44]|nr:hypothetical protein [Phormidesmis sp. CAN_BIN44]
MQFRSAMLIRFLNAIARSVMAKSVRRSTETSLQHRVNPSSSTTVE